MDTGDSNNYVIDCGKTHKFAWVGSSASSSLVKHNKKGQFELNLDTDCSVIQASSDDDEDKTSDDDDLSTKLIETLDSQVIGT